MHKPETSIQWLENLKAELESVSPHVTRTGLIKEAFGTLIRAVGVEAKIGDLCELREASGQKTVVAEVVGVLGRELTLMPYGPLDGLGTNTQVIPLNSAATIGVSDLVLGRVIDAFGMPLDGRNPIEPTSRIPVARKPPSPMSRRVIHSVLACGVRAIDTLTTVGEGQRIGIFAPAGVGKSTLQAMLVRGARSECSVVALVGERGREVREFVEHTLGPEGMRKTCIVAATSDAPAAERLRAAYVATAIAEYFRDQGRSVTLFIDSLTRFARAQREVGLASGEPPTRQGYPPSVFSVLPQLLERAGPAENGVITAFYTVLTDDEEANDPISEEVRSILDGHLVLSRKLAEKGQYPAIDVLASVSRLMGTIAKPAHVSAANRLRELIAKYRDIELLIQLGEYEAGSDTIADEAIAKWQAICALLRQKSNDFSPLDASLQQLMVLAGT